MAKQKYTGQMTTGKPLAERLVPDSRFLTPTWIHKITSPALIFFSKHPQYDTPEIREFICHGDTDVVREFFYQLEGFDALQEVLIEYRQLT